MQYKIKINMVRSTNENASTKAFATLVFGDSFRINNIAILENRENGKLFVSMPRYRTNEVDEHNNTVFRDVCHPITAECRAELYDAILAEYERVRDRIPADRGKMNEKQDMPEFSVAVTPYEREDSNIRGFARIYFEDSFVINNVDILQGRENLFVSMPSYKTGRKDRDGKDVYQDVCYPITKEFREKLYGEIERVYAEEKERAENAQVQGGQLPDRGNVTEMRTMDAGDEFLKVSGEPLPFR